MTSQQSRSMQVSHVALSYQGKSPAELAYMRRVCVREQKLYVIQRKLADELPVAYLKMHCFVLALLTLSIVSIQIVLIVYKSSLYYVCTGFWVGALFLTCLILIAKLSK